MRGGVVAPDDCVALSEKSETSSGVLTARSASVERDDIELLDRKPKERAVTGPPIPLTRSGVGA